MNETCIGDLEDFDFKLFNVLNELVSSCPIHYRDINFFAILRNDLGQKIARKFRFDYNADRVDRRYEFSQKFVSRPDTFSELLLDDFKKRVVGRKERRRHPDPLSKTIYFYQSTKLMRLAAFFESRTDVRILSNKRNFTSNSTWAPVLSVPDFMLSRKLMPDFFHDIEKNLTRRGIVLLEEDWDLLRNDCIKGLFNINQAYRLLDTYSCNLVVVGGDNFLPPLALVLAARHRNIPTLCLQHGLDCERFFHEQIFSDHLCVWGEHRAERCRNFSMHQPQAIHVTGCPEFDTVQRVVDVGKSKLNWLWLTRPHAPDKCCEPSRHPDEGRHIFEALLKNVVAYSGVSLVVKAHPRDDIEPYRQLVAAYGLTEKVHFQEGRGGVNDLIKNSGLVLSEDSTAGMEAMFFGKPLIHTHFSKAPPSLPFVDYKAALPGFDSCAIEESVRVFMENPERVQNLLLPGQVRFLNDFAGPMDGSSTNRIGELIDGLLAQSVICK